ncbi:MAG: BACON domain-containing protein [Clostridium sp.]|nr:BACON domain-containing protein [Clostridium sp.]
MKKSVLIWFTMLLACFVQTGCSEDIDDTVTDSVYLYTTSISAPAAEGEQSITIAATLDWTATPQADWLSVDVSSGKEGFTAVHVTWQANTTGAERIGTVKFTAGTYSDELTVTQKAE